MVIVRVELVGNSDLLEVELGNREIFYKQADHMSKHEAREAVSLNESLRLSEDNPGSTRQRRDE